MKKYLSKGFAGFVLSLLLVVGATPVFAAENPVTQPATDLTPTSATLNGTNGTFTADADTEAFWYGTSPAGVLGTPFTVGVVPPGWTSGIYADTDDENPNGPFSYSWTGLTPNTTYYYVAWVSVGGTWYPGSEVSFTTPDSTQTINFDAVDPKTYGDADFDVYATGGDSGEDVTFSASGSCTIDVATVTIVSAGDCTVTANQAAGNGYDAADPTDLVIPVAKKELTITSGVTVDEKEYDKTTDATLTFASPVLDGVVTGDEADVSVDTASVYTADFDDSNAGTGKAVTVTDIELAGAKASNYELTQPSLSGDITPRSITITAVTDTKVYDSTTDSSVIPTLTLGALATGDDLDFTQSYTTEEVGTGLTLTPDGTVDDDNDGDNYEVNFVDVMTGVITKRNLNVVPSASDKVYNANTVAAISFTDNKLSGDDVTVSGTGSFATKIVDTGKVVSLLTAVKSGADAGNYNLVVTPTVMLADITPAELTPVVTASSKVYDGDNTASATCTVSALGTDVVTCSVGVATFDTKDAGENKTVTATGITIDGDDSENYVLSVTTETDEADITPKELTVSFTADNKVYDGNESATILTRTATGTVGVETVVVSDGTATFDNKNFGTNKTVTAIEFTLSDSNYSVGTINTTTANITKRTLDVTVDGIDKVYDGGVSATVDFDDDRVSGDDLTITGTALFNDKHVADGKTVNVTGIDVTGVDAINYTWNTTASTTADITPRAITVTSVANTKVYDTTTGAAALPTITSGALQGTDTAVRSETYDDANVGTGKTMIPAIVITDGNEGDNYAVTLVDSENGTITAAPATVSFTADNKVYDGNTSATILTRTVTGNIAPDPVITATGGTAVFNNENVGTGKAVTASGFTLSNSNYEVTLMTPTTANITRATLTPEVSASSKDYDANTNASATCSVTPIGDDDVVCVVGSASFEDKDAGVEKRVDVSGMTLSGEDADNYVLSTTSDTTAANIYKRELTVSAVASDKVVDGTTTATVTLSNNAVLGDVVTQTYVSADFDDASVGTGKTVTVNGIAISGDDAENYELTSETAISTADINARSSSGGGGSRPRTSTGTTGTVLGFAKFNFTQNMKLGSVGNEVMELQKFLNNAGFGTLVVDGNFGPMTKAAVIKFQLANGLVGDGVVGPLTRAVLNK